MAIPGIISRALALLLLLGVVALLWFGVAAPLWTRAESMEDDLAHSRALIARYTQASGLKETLRERIGALTESIESSAHYIRADTEPLAAANAQGRLQQIVTQYGGNLLSVQNLPGVDEDGMRKIGLRVTMTAELDEIFYILHELEAGAPFFFADNLEIKSNAQRRRRADQDGDSILSVRFDVYGYLQPEVAS